MKNKENLSWILTITCIILIFGTNSTLSKPTNVQGYHDFEKNLEKEILLESQPLNRSIEITNNLPLTTREILPATITQVADSLGNINTNSWTKGTGGGWSCDPDCPDLNLQIGETVTFTITASDPNGLPLEYMFAAQPAGWSFITLQDWSSNNTFIWTVTEEFAGPWIPVMVAVRNNDGQNWQGDWNGDDYTYASYSVSDPNKAPATLTQIIDNLGNINTNSWTKGTGGDWSCNPDCPDLNLLVGENITFMAFATDPKGLPLEYKFSAQPAGGSFITLRDWNSSNTFTWNISSAYIGPWICVSISVRNSDGQEWQGVGNGDDYTYAIYSIYDPNKLPATLSQVVDSLGNVNTNSWTKGTGGNWSCYPDCPDLELRVGEVITFTATASDPKDLPLEYKFRYMHNGNIAQDWSSLNTFEWHVDIADIGPWSGISVHVRNNDGQEWQGEWSGDDYNYQTYTIYNKYIDDIEPKTTSVGSSTLTMRVEGANFDTNSIVKFNETDLATTFINSTELNVIVPEDLLLIPGEFGIKVFGSTDEEVSNTKIFKVEYTTYLPMIIK